MTQVLDLPRLTEFGKKYFDCPSFDGVELENEGNLASKGCHFESRLIKEELMTSMSIYYAQFTEFLAILLEETYWYRINRRYIGIAMSGKGQGCDYVYKPCVSDFNPVIGTYNV